MRNVGAVDGFGQDRSRGERAMQSHFRNPHFFNGIPKRMSIVWERGKREIDTAESGVRQFIIRYLCDSLAMLFDFCNQIGSSLFKTFHVFKSADGQIRGLGRNGKGWFIAIVIGGRQERRASVDVCQRGELQVGKSILLERSTLDDHIRTGSDGSEINSTLLVCHHAAKE